jgi:hypothetical protein
MSSSRQMSSVLGVTLLVMVALAGVACSGSFAPARSSGPAAITSREATSPADAVARRLMTTYGLHPVGAPRVGSATLSPSDVTDFADSSAAIGLPLARHAGERVSVVTYTLRERDQAREATIDAVFYAQGATVIGARMLPFGYLGGGDTALSDHSQFAAPGLAPGSPDLSGVVSVDVVGHDGGRVFTDRAQVSRITKLLQGSAEASGSALDNVPREADRIRLTFANGAEVQAELTVPRRGPAFLVYWYDGFDAVHYEPGPELVKLITNAGRAGS